MLRNASRPTGRSDCDLTGNLPHHPAQHRLRLPPAWPPMPQHCCCPAPTSGHPRENTTGEHAQVPRCGRSSSWSSAHCLAQHPGARCLPTRTCGCGRGQPQVHCGQQGPWASSSAMGCCSISSFCPHLGRFPLLCLGCPEVGAKRLECCGVGRHAGHAAHPVPCPCTAKAPAAYCTTTQPRDPTVNWVA